MNSDLAKFIIDTAGKSESQKARLLMDLIAEYPDEIANLHFQIETARRLSGGDTMICDVDGFIFNISRKDFERIENLKNGDRTVDAIKHLRSIQKSGLKEAKYAVVDYWHKWMPA